MSIVILGKTPTDEDLRKAREEYRDYIKITADIKKGIVAIGGEYHADAEQLLLKEFGCKQRDIWGGGYNFQTYQFETNAIINLRSRTNSSLEIIDPKIREAFLGLVKKKLTSIRRLK